jgi:hypothetical protein
MAGFPQLENLMKIPRIRTLLALLLVFAVPAKADDNTHSPRWELWTGSMADYTETINANTRSGGFLGARAGVSPSVGYFLSDQYEILLAPSFNFHSAGSFVAQVMFGVGVNFLGKSISDAYFGKLMFGFSDILDNKTSDNINFTLKNYVWSISGGKRVEISPSFSYSPGVTFTFEHERHSVISSFSIIPLQFSLLL